MPPTISVISSIAPSQSSPTRSNTARTSQCETQVTRPVDAFLLDEMMLRLQPTRLDLTQNEVKAFKRKLDNQRLAFSSPSANRRAPDNRLGPRYDIDQKFEAPRIRQGPNRSRDASVVYRQPRRLHPGFSVTSSESDIGTSDFLGSSMEDESDDLLGLSDDGVEQRACLALSDDGQNTITDVESLSAMLDSRLALGQDACHDEIWSVSASRPIMQYRQAATRRQKCGTGLSSSPLISLEDEVEDRHPFENLEIQCIPKKRQRSYSEPPEFIPYRIGPSHFMHDLLPDLPPPLIHFEEAYIADIHPQIPRNRQDSVRRGDTNDRRDHMRLVTPFQSHHSRHGRHDSVPVVASTSFSSPIRNVRHIGHARRQRGSSSFSVLGVLDVLESSRSPLEELVHDARSRLSEMGANASHHRELNSDAVFSQSSPWSSKSTSREEHRSRPGASPSSSPPFGGSRGHMRSESIPEVVYEEEGRVQRSTPRLAFRPPASLTRHRSRTPIWQQGSPPLLTEDVARSAVGRRSFAEQENEADDMTRFESQMRIWASLQPSGGVLERTPPRESDVERLQRE